MPDGGGVQFDQRRHVVVDPLTVSARSAAANCAPTAGITIAKIARFAPLIHAEQKALAFCSGGSMLRAFILSLSH